MVQRRLLSVVSIFALFLSAANAKYVDLKINLGGEAIDGFSAEEEVLNLDNSETLSKMRYHGDIKRGNPHPNVFKTQRFSRYEDLVLNIPVQDGVYSVSLLFAETWDGAFGPNKRVFDVYIGSQPTGIVKVLSQFDPFREGGAAGGIVKKFTNIATQNGLTVALRPIIQNPQIAGIVIQGYSYSDALLEDIPTVTSHLPSSDDFSILNNIGPRTPADPSIIYDPNANPKFKNSGASSNRGPPPPPPPPGGAGSIDLSLSSQTSTTSSSNFPGAYGGSPSAAGGFGSGMSNMGGTGVGGDSGAAVGGLGAQAGMKPMNGMGNGYGMGGYGGQSQYSVGGYGQPVYRRRLNSFPEPVEVDFPSSGATSITEPSGLTFSQPQGPSTSFAGDSNTFGGGVMSGGADTYQRGPVNHDGVMQSQSSGQIAGAPLQPMGMQSVPMGHPGLSSGTNLPSSSNGFGTSGATGYQSSSSMTVPSVMSHNQEIPAAREPSTMSNMGSSSMMNMNEEPSVRAPAPLGMNENYGGSFGREKSITNEYGSEQVPLGEPAAPRSGRMMSGNSGAEFEGHGSAKGAEGMPEKYTGGTTESSSHAGFMGEPRGTNQRWMHREAQAQSEQLHKLNTDGDIVRSEHVDSISRTHSENPNLEHSGHLEHVEHTERNTVNRGYDREDDHRGSDRGLSHMEMNVERTADRRAGYNSGYEREHSGRYNGRGLRGGIGSRASRSVDGREKGMEHHRGHFEDNDMGEPAHSRLRARHVERMTTQNEAQTRHDGPNLGAQRDESGREGGHEFYNTRMMGEEGRRPRYMKKSGRFQQGGDSGLEDGNYPPPPGIHNGVAQLEGICIHNETHCSCGMTDQPADEPCLVVMNNSTSPMICAESECNGHLVCACAAGANTLCKRSTVNSILVAVPDTHKGGSAVPGFDNNVKLCRRETLEHPIEVLVPML